MCGQWALGCGQRALAVGLGALGLGHGWPLRFPSLPPGSSKPAQPGLRSSPNLGSSPTIIGLSIFCSCRRRSLTLTTSTSGFERAQFDGRSLRPARKCNCPLSSQSRDFFVRVLDLLRTSPFLHPRHCTFLPTASPSPLHRCASSIRLPLDVVLSSSVSILCYLPAASLPSGR
jgi:hypothetical protein